MRRKLEGASSPLDATVETVLPGVHERLDAQRKATEDLHGIVCRLETKMDGCIESTQNSTLLRVETEANLMFRRIRGSARDENIESMDTEETAPRNCTSAVNSPNRTTIVNHLPIIPITYSSLCQLYDHWRGEGEYANIYEGGISRLESEKGSSWRRTWDNSANKRLSKVKSIVLAIQHESTQNEMSIADVLAMWEDIYSRHCNGKLSNFHAWAVENGKIALKKARGKSSQ